MPSCGNAPLWSRISLLTGPKNRVEVLTLNLECARIESTIRRRSGCLFNSKYMMQLTTAVLFLLSTIYGGPTIVTTEDAITRATFAPETVVSQPLTLENYVRVY